MPDEIEEDEPQHEGHWTPGDMAAHGHPFTEFIDLEGLSDEDLLEIVSLCNVDISDNQPETCVPCAAFVLLQSRHPETQISEIDIVVVPSAVAETPAPAQETGSVVHDEIESTLGTLDILREQVVRLFDPQSAARRAGFEPQELALLVMGSKKFVEQAEALATVSGGMSDDHRALVENVRHVLTQKGVL